MNHSRFWCLRLTLCLLAVSLCSTARAADRVVSGHVYLDANTNGKRDASEEGIGDVVITDGVNLVRTGDDGKYTITVADDPMIPYKPAQTVSISWPSQHWPTTIWWWRMSDIKDRSPVDFGLREDKQELPFTFVHGSDPHDNGASYTRWGREVARLGQRAKFAVVTGDLGYMGFKNADTAFTSLQQQSQSFSMPLFHTIGNHDVVGIHTDTWSQQNDVAGNGGYTKYLGPIRWSFNYAGVHFVGMDWALIKGKNIELGVHDVASDWPDKDLEARPKDSRVWMFIHSQWSPTNKFWDVLVKHKIEMMLAGHSHRNLDVSSRGIKAWTTMNLRGPYRLVNLTKDGHEIVDRCMGCKDPTYHSRKCKLKLALPTVRRDAHAALADVVLDRGERAIDGVSGTSLELAAELAVEGSAKCTIRFEPVGGSSDDAKPIDVVCQNNELIVDGVWTSAIQRTDQTTYQLNIILDADKLTVYANGRVFIEKPIKTPKPLRIRLISADGTTTIKKLDAWSLK